VTVIVLAVTAGSPSAQGNTVLYLDSEPGDWVGAGIQQTMTPGDGTFSADRTFDNGVAISFLGFNPGNFWHLQFAAPGKATLVPGVYEGATRWPFQAPTDAGLSVSGDGRGCNTLTGRFEVLEAVYGAGGEVVSFAADFEQHCEGGEPALFGGVRFNSSIPLSTKLEFSAAAYSVAESGGSVDITVARRGSSSGEVTVEFTTGDGSAVAGSDYTATSGVLAFADGQTSKTFTIPILDDSEREGDETVDLTLANPTGGATLGGRQTAVLTITDAELIDAAEYFPSMPGTMWRYAQTGGAEFTTRVLDKLIRVNGTPTAVFEDSPSGARAFYTADAAGLLLHRLFQRDVFIPGLGRVNVTLTFDPPVQWAEALTDIGRTASSNGVVEAAVGSRRVPLVYSASFTVEGLDTVTVPAGTFDVVRIQGTLTIEGESLEFSFDLARGIGVVRAVADDLEGNRSTLELISTNADDHDLAVTRIVAPRSVTLTARMPARTVPVKVVIQNRSPHSETIPDSATLANLVTLTVESLGACAAPVPVLVPPRRFPVTLKPRQTLTVGFNVTFGCANDPAASTPRDPAHRDYRYTARVDHAALDGVADTRVEDDVCPRPPLGLDPDPDGRILDPGCGDRNPDRTLGADVLTDVIMR
jgi:hypothetical protein